MVKNLEDINATCGLKSDVSPNRSAFASCMSVTLVMLFFLGPVVISFIQWGHVDNMERLDSTLDCSAMDDTWSKQDMRRCEYQACSEKIGMVAGLTLTEFSRWNGGIVGIGWIGSGLMYVIFTYFVVTDSAHRKWKERNAKAGGVTGDTLGNTAQLGFNRVVMLMTTLRNPETFPWGVLYGSSLVVSLFVSFTMHFGFFNEAIRAAGDGDTATCIKAIPADGSIGFADGIGIVKILYASLVISVFTFFVMQFYAIINAFWVKMDPVGQILDDGYGSYRSVPTQVLVGGHEAVMHRPGGKPSINAMILQS